MLRHEWGFLYSGEKLAKAARSQADFRAGRVKVWEEKKEEIMKKIREQGLTVHEDISDLLSNNSMGKYKGYSNLSVGGGPTIMIDATMQKELSECHGKVQHHRALQKEYEAWEQVLMANPAQHLNLHHDDWTYFFGK